MRVLFCRSTLPGSWAIRKLTGSDWSHCALVMGDVAIEATWPRVRMTSVQEIIARHDRHEFRHIDCPDEIEAWAFAQAQIGKRYDVLFLFGWLFRDRNWQRSDQWACSELIAKALAIGGRELFPDLSRVTPQDLFYVSHRFL